ncbi:MAG: hypothetical protein KC635_09965 [Myxococcales bacterium]|nr:hypothetical protein [Myxococcales bacterium]MCB9732809.1 hypothetical protein [Deltaproteobacteria bacterium]
MVTGTTVARCVAGALLALLAAGGAARADVVPDGQRYVPVAVELRGLASLGGRHVYLATVNGRERSVASAVPVTADGPLAVPSGYMDRSYLVALTPEQDEAMKAAEATPWEPDAERREPSPLRRFLDRPDVASTSVLPFRGLVARGSDAARIVETVTLHGADGEHVTATVERAVLDADGSPVGDAGGGLIVALAIAVAAVAAGALGWALTRRGRRAAAPGA